jgi:hypothetical protein
MYFNGVSNLQLFICHCSENQQKHRPQCWKKPQESLYDVKSFFNGKITQGFYFPIYLRELVNPKGD